MAATRIPALTVLTGAQSATDDKIVIFDATADETKAITRVELGKGIVGDLPYTPSGGIAATTVIAAIAELDTEKQPIDANTAKLNIAQVFTAQQTLSSGLVLQTISAADIAAIANAVNTTGKVAGKVVYDTTNFRLMVANGSAAADRWYVADGSAFVTPA